MLSVYPIAATAENWIHETVSSKVKSALVALNSGDPAPTWSEGMREELSEREGLKICFEAFCAAAGKISSKQRSKVLEALDAQNNIPAVFDGVAACPTLSELPPRVRRPIKELYEEAFDLLKVLKVRDRQYEVIFAKLPGKCCPFCGIEPFEAPGLAREDLDHYLPKNIYPFAGANLRNLSPMGGKCNSSYKLAKDVIYNGSGQRQRCFDPYGQQTAEISLRGSRPFEGNVVDLVPLPAWQMELVGDKELVENWDRIFKIRRRYEGKADAHFHDWTEDFAIWCSQEVGVISSREEVVNALGRYITAVVFRRFGEAAHLRRAVFEMMHWHCKEGEGADRLAAWLIDLVHGQTE
jgi:hypothetical protein